MQVIIDAVQRAGLGARFALDVASVSRGIRKLGLLHVESIQEHATRTCLAELGLVVVASRVLHRFADPGSREHILVDSRTSRGDDCQELWFAKPGARVPSATDLFSDPGLHLGYPDCCTRFMKDSSSLAFHYRRYLFDSAPRLWEINRLTTLFSSGLLMPDFFPCSLACEEARRFATPFIQLAEEILPEGEAARWIRQAKQPLLIYQGSLYSFSDWRIEGSTLHLKAGSARRVTIGDVAVMDASPKTDGPTLLDFSHLRSGSHAVAPTVASIEPAIGDAISIQLSSMSTLP
jgi:hypothetical protein